MQKLKNAGITIRSKRRTFTKKIVLKSFCLEEQLQILLEPIAFKVVCKTNKNAREGSFKGSRLTTKAIEELNEKNVFIEVSELMKKLPRLARKYLNLWQTI